MATTRVVAGILGYIFAGTLIASPIWTMIDIRRENSVGQRSTLSYLGTCANAVAMVAYTLPAKSYAVAVINSVAILAELGYIYYYRRHAQGRARTTATWGLIGEGLWMVLLAVGYFAFFFRRDREDLRVKIFGSIGAVSTGVMYAVMFFDTNILLVLAAVSNSVSWAVFASKPRDRFIEVPNILGAILTAIQLLAWVIVKFWYGNAPPPPPRNDPPPPPPPRNDPPPPPPPRNDPPPPPPPPQQLPYMAQGQPQLPHQEGIELSAVAQEQPQLPHQEGMELPAVV